MNYRNLERRRDIAQDQTDLAGDLAYHTADIYQGGSSSPSGRSYKSSLAELAAEGIAGQASGLHDLNRELDYHADNAGFDGYEEAKEYRDHRYQTANSIDNAILTQPKERIQVLPLEVS